MEPEIDMESISAVSEIELMYKSKVKSFLRPKVIHSRDAYLIFLKYWDKNKIELTEQFAAMFMNRANKVLAIFQLSSGGITGTIADSRLIFVAALKVGACSMVLCHNHPSGNLLPSKSDEEFTMKIKQAGKLLEINLLDHIILTPSEGYFSMADNGMI